MAHAPHPGRFAFLNMYLRMWGRVNRGCGTDSGPLMRSNSFYNWCTSARILLHKADLFWFFSRKKSRESDSERERERERERANKMTWRLNSRLWIAFQENDFCIVVSERERVKMKMSVSVCLLACVTARIEVLILFSFDHVMIFVR